MLYQICKEVNKINRKNEKCLQKKTFGVLFECVKSRVTHADSRFLFFNQQIDILKKICTHLRQKNMEANTKLNSDTNKKINKEKQLKIIN